MYKFLIRLSKNERWTSLGKYMEPKDIIYDDEIYNNWGGYARYYPFSTEIHIKKKYKNDEGIKQHELAHARQYGRLFWIHSFMGMISGKYRLIIELEAYRNQVKYYDYNTKKEYNWIIQALYKKYNTGVKLKKIQELADYMFIDIIGQSSL